MVGLALALAMAALAWLFPAGLRGPLAAAGTGFVLGAAFHLAFEATGLNATYSRTGHACTS